MAPGDSDSAHWSAGGDAERDAPALARRDPTGVGRLVAAGEHVDGALRLDRSHPR